MTSTEKILEEFEEMFHWTDFDGGIGTYILSKKTSRYGTEETERNELRAFLATSIHQVEQEMKDRCMRAIYDASPTIVGMRNEEAELWGKATTLFLETLSSLDTPDKD